MKVGIITIHYGFNFGSALQSYALAKYMGALSEAIEVEVINYIPKRYSVKRRYFSTNKPYTQIKKIFYLILVAPYQFFNQLIFDRFLNTYVPLSPKIIDEKTARKKYQNCDYLIVGSDQVWNSDYNEGIDPMYYLDFAGENTEKISYAASCGKDDYTEQEWKNICTYLTDFSKISVREMMSVDIFRKHGITQVECTLDPIFLLSKEEWIKIGQKPHGATEHLVLIYCLDSDEGDLIRIAKQVAKNRKLKTAIITHSHIWNKYDVEYIFRNQTPNNFIWLIANADYVVTNSFHGVSFSINFEKQFVAVKRRKYNNRLDSILETMCLTSRYISYDADFDNRKDVDYRIINAYKKTNVDNSMHYLKSAIKIEDKT